MGTLRIEVGAVQARAVTGATLPVYAAVPLWSANITTTGASVASDLGAAVAGKPGLFAHLVADADTYVAFGAAPDASAEPRRLLKAGAEYDFDLDAAAKIAVRTA